jgi:hypothetical protein
MILNANDRPNRKDAAATGKQIGCGVDHRRGYKAIRGRRQGLEPLFSAAG